MSEPLGDVEAAFAPLRPRLLRIAYRMLGSVADAEDVVQDAFLRWFKADRDSVREPEGFLVRTVTRLCLDLLKSARYTRETYIGPWLPEPLIEAEPEEPDDFTLPLMLALERLSPLERAAFLLHDVFGMAFDAIGEAIGRDPAACRQLASRARTHVRASRPRFVLPREQSLRIAEAFFQASRTGNMAQLQSLLTADVVLITDGGGKAPAASAPILGQDAVLAVHKGLIVLFTRTPSRLLRFTRINGLPGFVSIEGGTILQTTAFDLEEGRIRAIYITRNPQKLAHLAPLLGDQP